MWYANEIKKILDFLLQMSWNGPTYNFFFIFSIFLDFQIISQLYR